MTDDDKQEAIPPKLEWPPGITREQIIQLVRDKIVQNGYSDGMQTAYLKAWLAREEPGPLAANEAAMAAYVWSLRGYCRHLVRRYAQIDYDDIISLLNEVAANCLQDDRVLESVYHYGGTMLWWRVRSPIYNLLQKKINHTEKTVSMTDEMQNHIADEGADPLEILVECEARTTERLARLKTVPKPLRAIAEKLLRAEPLTESDYQALLRSSHPKKLANLVKELVDDHAGEC